VIDKFFHGKTFDDFLLRPSMSAVSARRDVDLTLPFIGGSSLALPLAGANVDTVTGSKMAQSLALVGGVGFVHRNCTIEKEVEMVTKVKRQHSFIIDNPLILPQDALMSEAKEVADAQGVSSILISDKRGSVKLAGLLSHRDMPQNGEYGSSPVSTFMTPRSDLVTSPISVTIEKAEEIMFAHRVEKLPLIDGGDQIKGLITMRDLRMVKQRPYSSKDSRGRLQVGAAIGATGDFMERAEALISAGTDYILMDVAHAHSAVVRDAMRLFREKFSDIDLVAGNVGTAEGARFLVELGANAVKVGIGPGRGCRTRLETGAGVPQLQAIRDVYNSLRDTVPIIADGGVKNDKDIFLAIACGATSVMMGSVLAGTDESPGMLITDPATGLQMKVYRGMTSPEAVIDGSYDERVKQALQTPQEGQSIKVPYRGSVMGILERIRGHLASSVSYAGGTTLAEARTKIATNPEFYLISLSESAKKESFDR